MSEPESVELDQHEDIELDLATDTTDELENTDEVTSTEEVIEPESVDDKPADTTEKFQKQMNKKHFQYKEEERKRIALERELDELRSKSEPQAITGPVEVPQIPDPFDDAYEQKIKARDQAIAANANYQVQARMQEQGKARELQARQRAEVERQSELNDTLSKNIDSLGLDSEKVYAAHDTLSKYGVEPETAHFLLTDKDGPLIAMYFENNLQEFDDFMSRPGMERGMMIADLKAKASAYKPKTTNAPDPAPSISGRTAPADRGPEGATYE